MATAEQFAASTPLPADIDAERGFLGCVLAAPHSVALRLMAGMRADDFADPMAGQVAQLVIELVAAGHPPHPTAVLAHAEATGRVPALRDPTVREMTRTARDGGEGRYRRLTHWLIDAYSIIGSPELAAYLKASVLERAWRRAITEHATRLQQAAHTSPTDVLADLADDTAHINQLWDRYHAASTCHEPAARAARRVSPVNERNAA